MKSNRITIKDIARQAGVSIGTVDRVLHERGEVAAVTRARILDLAEKMNYKPNLFARALTSKKQYHILALIPQASDENIYWVNHKEGILSQAKELEAYSVKVTVIHFELHNEDDFMRQASNVLEQHPDGVIFAPILRKESLRFAEQLDAANIPYIFIDTYIKDSNCIGFIGEDAFQSGRVAASIIDFGISPESDILMVNLAKDLDNTQHLTSRNQGFMSYFMDAGRNKGMKISLEIATSVPAEVADKLTRVLAANPNIGAVWVSSAKAYVVARYLEQANVKNMILVGYEVYNHNIDYMRKDYIQYLIAQQPREQGSKAVKAMFGFLAEHTPPIKLEYQKIEIVNSENIRFYV